MGVYHQLFPEDFSIAQREPVGFYADDEAGILYLHDKQIVKLSIYNHGVAVTIPDESNVDYDYPGTYTTDLFVALLFANAYVRQEPTQFDHPEQLVEEEHPVKLLIQRDGQARLFTDRYDRVAAITFSQGGALLYPGGVGADNRLFYSCSDHLTPLMLGYFYVRHDPRFDSLLAEMFHDRDEPENKQSATA